jgi:hypothetical protein
MDILAEGHRSIERSRLRRVDRGRTVPARFVAAGERFGAGRACARPVRD